MTNAVQNTHESQNPRVVPTTRRFTKVRAILAGGVVLGVGAAVTLAAWNDSEFATGTFAAGSFGIEGSTDGVTFTDHASADNAAALDFQVNADNLTPGDQVYANFSIQLNATSSYTADVSVSSTSAGANAGNLSASYVYTDAPVCDAGAFAAGSDADVSTFELAAVEDPVHLCFEVTALPTLEQGLNGEITWSFDAVSGDTLG